MDEQAKDFFKGYDGSNLPINLLNVCNISDKGDKGNCYFLEVSLVNDEEVLWLYHDEKTRDKDYDRIVSFKSRLSLFLQTIVISNPPDYQITEEYLKCFKAKKTQYDIDERIFNPVIDFNDIKSIRSANRDGNIYDIILLDEKDILYTWHFNKKNDRNSEFLRLTTLLKKKIK
jgi:hypothetical protein